MAKKYTTEVNSVPIQYLSYYEDFNGSTSNINKPTKQYKQYYRPAWEKVPHFKGWLRGVEDEPTRAYCTYCQKTLHAHRLSLLKHTTTSRHQKAADFYIKQSQEAKLFRDEFLDHDGFSNISHEEGIEVTVNKIEYCEPLNTEVESMVYRKDDEVVELVEDTKDIKIINSDASPISTHVIDNTSGKPISDLRVTLYQLNNGRWTHVSEGVTNANGIFNKFIERADFTAGRYKLHYDVDRHFLTQKQKSRFPFIEVIVDVSLMDTCHIPLYVSPHGYSAFGGS